MPPSLIAYCATPSTHTGCVGVGHEPSRLRPSAAFPAHAPDAGRYGASEGGMA